jgi:6-phosphofructokinase
VTAKKIGILTGGGHCPGLNAAIRAVVRVAEATAGAMLVDLEQLADVEVFFG